MKFLDFVTINPRVSFVKGQKYPFVEMGNVSTTSRNPIEVEVKPYSSGVKFQKGDTVIARITPCLQNGKKFYCKNIVEGFGSTEYLVFRPKNNSIDNLYLYYFMTTEFIRQIMINSMTGATGRQRVNCDVFDDLEVSFPSIEIQKKIGRILSAYDDLIENNQKQIKLLEEAAQRLYKEWFIDLRFPGHEDAEIVDGIPEDWKMEPVGSVIKTVPRTLQIKTKDYLPDGTIPIIDQSREFIAGYTNLEDAIVLSETPVIVFGDHTRILKYIQFPFAKGADGTQLIISNTELMPEPLLYLSLLSVDLSNYHYARHFKYLKEEMIIIPSQEIADSFNNIVDPLFKRVQVLRDINRNCEQARDRLLPKLMSGEIEV